MLSILFAFTSLALSQPAYAINGSPIVHMDPGFDGGAGPSDAFGKLEELYLTAAQPTLDDVKGWRAGRCYRYDSPNTPTGDLLIGDTVTVGADNGPLFPPSDLFKLVSIGADLNEPANVFDTVNEELSKKLAETFKSYANLTSEVRPDLGGLVVSMASAGVEFHYRKADNGYIFARVEKTAGGTRALRDGGTYMMCYYFKKVK